jgi:hypothetical protein
MSNTQKLMLDLMKPGSDLILLQNFINLRPRTEYQNQPDSQAVQKGNIMDDIFQIIVRQRFSAKRENHNLISLGIDIG